jgi:hypothetical protein
MVLEKQKDVVVKKLRRFHSSEDVYKHIASIITIYKMTDFGPLLKGQDFEDDDTIARGALFRTLTSLVQFSDNDGITEGDVLDLLNEEDPE